MPTATVHPPEAILAGTSMADSGAQGDGVTEVPCRQGHASTANGMTLAQRLLQETWGPRVYMLSFDFLTNRMSLKRDKEDC